MYIRDNQNLDIEKREMSLEWDAHSKRYELCGKGHTLYSESFVDLANSLIDFFSYDDASYLYSLKIGQEAEDRLPPKEIRILETLVHTENNVSIGSKAIGVLVRNS